MGEMRAPFQAPHPQTLTHSRDENLAYFRTSPKNFTSSLTIMIMRRKLSSYYGV